MIIRGIELSDKLIKLAIGIELIKLLIPIPLEELFVRYYMGKYRVRVIERIANKSYVEFLEEGIVGNKKIGYRKAKKGELLFVYTRSCWGVKK